MNPNPNNNFTSNFIIEKNNFIKEFSPDYGYNGKIDQIREVEYQQLKGTTIHANSALTSFTKDISTKIYGNPHSSNSPSSQLTAQRVEKVRTRILNHFNVKPGDYQVIFTQNTTAAIKIVGEAFPWTKRKSKFIYLREAHNSLIGLRRFAEEHQINDVKVVSEDDLTSMSFIDQDQQNPISCYGSDDDNGENQTNIYNLFAYPAQCNFSGQRFPFKWSKEIKRLDSKFLVLLDAASFVSSSLLSLEDKDSSPDFVVMSFYKMFGFPTGLGALLVKSELSPILKKRYFGGGTIQAIAYDRPWQIFREKLSERFEDGTINFLDIVALDHAFTVSENLYTNFDFIKKHVTSLITYLYRSMKSLYHSNGEAVCVIYSNKKDFSDNTGQGPVINFNVKRSDGSWVGYLEVERLAGMNGIHIRAGEHCNPGSVAKWINVTTIDRIENYKAGKTCGDEQDMFNGKPTGSLRVSLGSMSTIDDILGWLDFLEKYFVENKPSNLTSLDTNKSFKKITKKFNHGDDDGNSQLFLETVTLYPIKSCHGLVVPWSTSWPITAQGLLYDREWMLVDSETGQALSQKKVPRMALLLPSIQLEKGVLIINAPNKFPLQLDLNEYPEPIDFIKCDSRVCGDRIQSIRYKNSEINEWFTSFLGVSCQLARFPPIINIIDNDENKKSLYHRHVKPHLEVGVNATPISLSNESPFLMISKSSVINLNEKIRNSGKNEISADCFRGNFLIKGAKKYEEDGWKLISIGEQVFEMIGPCRRCHMVCINQETAEKSNEPYSTLALNRRFNGRIYFGQHMIHVPERSCKPYIIKNGSSIRVLERLDSFKCFNSEEND
nr:1412_t:CDS:10 [Entrophospora candida]